ncbi:ATP-dependent Clp protease proteolytic subunit [Terrilactibacillus tamarindi]|uniref:ATP-dependent Clp protease proteolytic subunit n=1 Tax=Terrilactibacillus tamarindi TaxID=2599694 RepID=UPI0038B5671C
MEIAQRILKTKKDINEIIAETSGQPLNKVEQDTERDHSYQPRKQTNMLIG